MVIILVSVYLSCLTFHFIESHQQTCNLQSGTAFTRSIGDGIAEELGVTAEPEMLTRELTKEDKIIVLASDGVFEVR